MSKQIPLTQGQVAIVDDADYDELIKYKWYAEFCKDTRSYRVVRWGIQNNVRTVIKIHRQIMELTKNDGLQVDHVDHNALNNCRNNLRIVTNLQNQMNRRSNSNVTSKYKGVSWHIQTRKWRATIMINRKQKHLGVFICETDAALAYNKAAKEMFGEFAYLNTIV